MMYGLDWCMHLLENTEMCMNEHDSIEMCINEHDKSTVHTSNIVRTEFRINLSTRQYPEHVN